MELKELLELLDLESPDDFAYFEHFADLIECQEFIEYEDFYMILSTAPTKILCELTETYFEEILANLPDNIIDIYTLLTSIQNCLIGLASNEETQENRRLFVDELYKFRNWYAFEGAVHCLRRKDGASLHVPIFEALALCRLEKLNEDSYEYDFSDCLEYELDSYSMNVSSILHTSYESDAEQEEDEDALYTDGLVDRDNPVIDGEYTEEY